MSKWTKLKLEEAQAISEAVLDAEVKIGELMAKVPTQSKYNAVKRQDTDVPSFERKTKTEIIKDAGFTPKQVQRFETLAKNRDIVVSTAMITLYIKTDISSFYP